MYKFQPYVGITGFMERKEVERAVGVFPKKSNRLLMVGVLASTTTLKGERPTRFYGRYPRIEKIREIFTDDRTALNIIHFNDKTGDDERLLSQLLEITKLAGENLHGFQLNAKWPKPGIIAVFKKIHPEKKVILQIGAGAYKEVENNPGKMAVKARDYAGLADYLLLDLSGGEGKELDPEIMLKNLFALETVCGNGFGYGVAGGLSPESACRLLAPVFKKYPDTSTDAEDRIRDADNGDRMNLKRMDDLIETQSALLGIANNKTPIRLRLLGELPKGKFEFMCACGNYSGPLDIRGDNATLACENCGTEYYFMQHSNHYHLNIG